MNRASERKHVSQMTEKEIQMILAYAKNIPKKEWSFSPYIKKRMEERRGDEETILNILDFGDLIEYHLKDKKSRILLRGHKPPHSNTYFVPCAVFELKSKKVITVYWNHIDDHHRTINMNPYNEKMNILSEFAKNE